MAANAMAPLPSSEAPAPAIETMRGLVQRGETRSLTWRLGQLDRLQHLLQVEENEATSALAADLGKPELEAHFELVAVRQELALTRKHLRRWMRPRAVGLPGWALPGRAAIHPEPLGCVLILGPWNYPLQLCLHPLVSALAAGNTAVLKPSEHAPIRPAGWPLRWPVTLTRTMFRWCLGTQKRRPRCWSSASITSFSPVAAGSAGW